MSKYVKMVYEDWNEIDMICKIKSILLPFNDHNSIYLESQSYSENFENFVQDCFECGFAILADGSAIPIFQIKKFIPYTQDAEKKNPIRKNHRKQTRNKPKSESQSNIQKPLENTIEGQVNE